MIIQVKMRLLNSSIFKLSLKSRVKMVKMHGQNSGEPSLFTIHFLSVALQVFFSLEL